MSSALAEIMAGFGLFVTGDRKWFVLGTLAERVFVKTRTPPEPIDQVEERRMSQVFAKLWRESGSGIKRLLDALTDVLRGAFGWVPCASTHFAVQRSGIVGSKLALLTIHAGLCCDLESQSGWVSRRAMLVICAAAHGKLLGDVTTLGREAAVVFAGSSCSPALSVRAHLNVTTKIVLRTRSR